jgi:DNA-directed RNA polymerase specialized sigma24 family protein
MQEEEIIKAILSGGRQQEQALAALYRKGAEWRRYFVYRKGLSAEMAEDVVQDSVCKIFRSAASFTGGGGFGEASANAWMRTIANSCFADAMRKVKSPNFDIEDLDVPSGDKVADAEKGIGIYRSEPRPLTAEQCVSAGIEDFAADFPDRARALEMQMDGVAISSIADRIGRTSNATKAYLCECRKKLAPYIEHCLPLLAV